MKKLFLTLSSLAMLLLVSCDKEYAESGYTPENGFRLSYHVPGVVSATTRASIAVEEGEDNIGSFYILFFESTTGGTGSLVDVIDVTSTYNTSLGTTGTLDIEYPAGSPLNSSADYNLLLCANINDYAAVGSADDIMSEFAGKTEKEVISLLTLNVSGVEPSPAEETDDSNRILSSNLPMSAKVTKTAKQNSISVDLLRTVSRFDVFCQAAGYQLFSASIWNAQTSSKTWEAVFNDWSEQRTERFYGVGVNQKGDITGALYAFENYVAKPAQKDRQTTCLIVGLTNISTGKVEYFRTNINASDMGQQLKRNNVYRTTVRSVNSRGDESEREAFENAELKIDVDINGWTLDDSGNIHYDGENILALPTRLINLSPLGETREYNVFTLGEGTLEISNTDLPAGVTASLVGNILTVECQVASAEAEGSITMKFGELAGSIQVKQQPYITDYIDLDIYEVPIFATAKGQTSPDINVTASGEWIAEIYNGAYFSFSASTLVRSLQGSPGSSFNITSFEKNTATDSRYSFVLVKLKNAPEVSRVVLLEQAGTSSTFLSVDPTTFPIFSGGGGYTPAITVYSSGSWTATLTTNTDITSAGFVEAVDPDAEGDTEEDDADEVPQWTGNNGDAFSVKVNMMTVADQSAIITVTVKLDGTDVEKSFTIKQAALSQNSLILQTRAPGSVASLFDLAKAISRNYVFQLGTNMRNAALFGPDGIVGTKGEYMFVSGKKASPLASIYQVTGSPSKSEYIALKAWQQERDNRLIFFTHNSSARNKDFANYTNELYGTNFSTTTGPGSASTDRVFVQHPDMNNKLYKYLLDGPFGEVDPANVKLKSRSGTNRSISTWPDTFIPLIISKSSSYCVLGIDPVHRIIWASDPGIFGSKPGSGLANQVNFDADHNDNMVFLNNLIAWITNAAMYGDIFLDDFR